MISRTALAAVVFQVSISRTALAAVVFQVSISRTALAAVVFHRGPELAIMRPGR
jgi:hypothetical protein